MSIDSRTGIHVKRRQRKKDTRPAVDRFFAHIQKFFNGYTHCWLWTKGTTFHVSRGVVTTPARFIYQEHFGKLPDELALYRTCKTLRCVRPEHQEARRSGT